jgi:hypothetical protein
MPVVWFAGDECNAPVSRDQGDIETLPTDGSYATIGR